MQNTLDKSLPTVNILAGELPNNFDHFFRLSVFPDLFNKVILNKFKFS